MRFYIALWVAKFVAFVVNIINKEKGSNISGKIATRICPDFVKHFKNLDYNKVIMCTGTNGKTTTTGMVTHLFKTAGKEVATNKEGANMMGGVATTLIKNSSLFGKYKPEYLVLEIDERSLEKVIKVLPAKHLCITNLQKDQVQRNGDPDFIYRKFERAINKEMTLYLNNEEPRSKALEEKCGQAIYYSVCKNTASFEKNDFYDITLPCPKCLNPIAYEYYNLESIGKFHCMGCNHSSEEKPSVYINKVDYENKRIECDGEEYSIEYNTPFYIYNYAAIISIAKNFNIDFEHIKETLNTFVNPLERREKLKYKDKNIYYLRMKQENPETLQNALDTVAKDHTPKVLFMGLYEIKDFPPAYTNTFYFFDCDFTKVVESNVEKYIVFSKTVCYDCANRMMYAGAPREKIKVLDLEDNIEDVMKELDDFENKNVYFITGMKPYEKIKAYLKNI